jgi:hypothetical protein
VSKSAKVVLACVDTRELKDRWVAAFKRYVEIIEAGGRRDEDNNRADIEAELLIRRESAPHELVKREWDLMRQIAEDLRRDPDRLAEVEEALQIDIAEFEASSKKSPTN